MVTLPLIVSALVSCRAPTLSALSFPLCNVMGPANERPVLLCTSSQVPFKTKPAPVGLVCACPMSIGAVVAPANVIRLLKPTTVARNVLPEELLIQVCECPPAAVPAFTVPGGRRNSIRFPSPVRRWRCRPRTFLRSASDRR